MDGMTINHIVSIDHGSYIDIIELLVRNEPPSMFSQLHSPSSGKNVSLC